MMIARYAKDGKFGQLGFDIVSCSLGAKFAASKTTWYWMKDSPMQRTRDGSVPGLRRRYGVVRVRVRVVVEKRGHDARGGVYPGRCLRGELGGAATGGGERSRQVE